MERALKLLLAFAAALMMIACMIMSLVVWHLGPIEIFGNLVAVDDQAEMRIRHEFDNWIRNDLHIRQCAFAVVGIVSDTGEHAVFSGGLDDLIEIAERFSGQPIAEFDLEYEGDDFAVVDLDLDFPSDRSWAPTQIKNGRFYELQNWTSENHGTGKFVAIDYDTSQIYMLKWSK